MMPIPNNRLFCNHLPLLLQVSGELATFSWRASTKGMFANMAKTSSVWHYVSKMPQEQFGNMYGRFPQRVRYHLGDWLETQPWDHISGTDSFSTEMANSVLKKLVEELEKVSRNCGSDAPLVLQWVENFKRLSQQEPIRIIHLFKTVCKGEMDAVVKKNTRLSAVFQCRQEEMLFNFRSMKLQHKLEQMSLVKQNLNIALENLTFQVQDLSSLQKQWVMLVEESLNSLSTVQDQALKRIDIWKKQQQMAGNGAPFDGNMLPLQDRLEFLFGIYDKLFHMVGELGETGQRLVTPRFFDQINSGFGALIKSSFLVDKQPPQVLKTQTKFQSSVNFMLGSKILSGINKMPVIRANIVTDKKAQELFLATTSEALNEIVGNNSTRTGTRMADDGTGEIENGRSVFEITQATRSCGAVFKNMLLKKIKRCERKGSESVTEEKCAILFTAEINFSGSTYIVQALSLPVVVIVHGNQDNNAKATILWDNAFSEIGRRPFYVEEKVPWKKMCHTLNMKFVSEVGTKHELSPEHFWFLAQKIFGENCIRLDDLKERTVSWAQFNKEPLQERNFTFWQWFDGVVELTRKHLRDYWSDGLIMGFVSKQYLHKLLSNEPNGTFLLRFSDSEIGGITIAHVLHGSGQIQNIQPFTAKDLQILSLGDRVKDLKQLTHLYQKGRKDDAFEKYYKKVPDSSNGYTKTVITLKVAPNFPNSRQAATDLKKPAATCGESEKNSRDENEEKPSAWNDVQMEEGDICQPSTSTNVQYASPIYGSPAGSPIGHIPAQPLYNPVPMESYGLIPSLPPLPEPTQYPPNVPFMPQYSFVENERLPWVQHYIPEAPNIQQENFSRTEFDLQEILGILNSEVALTCIQEDPIPMQ
ncbi:signal transducer and activator of transcription 6 isoform X3 [Mixophyes fleayi]|uniref:signal transducer and activator of transcription 6 isoform X3 n=1 Tax=Mixophyes fleayi TaxID=3061075 RepID=UPI003F4DF224